MDFLWEQNELSSVANKQDCNAILEDCRIMSEESINDKEFNPFTTRGDSTKVESIGEAWLDNDGGITLDLRCDADGAPLSALFTYKANDRDYDKILQHLGGLKPGEVKQVPPFPDKNK